MTGAAAAAVALVEGLVARTEERVLLDAVSLTLCPGQVTALLGPSGSGKTTTALALLGECGPNVRLSGRVSVAGELVVADGVGAAELAAARRRVRGGVVAYLPQHVDRALHPSRRVGSVLDEVARTHHPAAARAARRELVAEALRVAHFDDTGSLLRRFPHQFSGGQRQRLLLAQTLLCAPRVLVLDEPTTGLDPLSKEQVVHDLGTLAGTGLAVLLLTHDPDVVRALAHDAVLLRDGRVHYRGPVPDDLAPARRTGGPGPGADGTGRIGASAPQRPVLAADSVTATYRTSGRVVTALRDVDLHLEPGECVGVVGRSGSGKTTLARCLAGLHRVERGQILLDGAPVPVLRRRDVHQRRRVQYVWQDIRGSFTDRRPVLDQIARSAVRLRGRTVEDARAESQECLDWLGVSAETARRPPGELSGGELRRAALARALLARPDVLICDEITSSLDAERTSAILRLLAEWQRSRGMAVLLISHDWSVVTDMADRVITLDGGGVVETRVAPAGGTGPVLQQTTTH